MKLKILKLTNWPSASISSIQSRIRALVRKSTPTRFYIGKSLANIPEGAVVFFPLSLTRFNCGLAGIVAFKQKSRSAETNPTEQLVDCTAEMETRGFRSCHEKGLDLTNHYLCGGNQIEKLLGTIRSLKESGPFYQLYHQPDSQTLLRNIQQKISRLVQSETDLLSMEMGRLDSETVDALAKRIEALKDAAWQLDAELMDNIVKIQYLLNADHQKPSIPQSTLSIYKNINAVLNSIDRLEVRGRDSAGISLMFVLKRSDYLNYMKNLEKASLTTDLEQRATQSVLVNKSVTVNESAGMENSSAVSICFVYKIAAEIGRLGDNIRFLREQIRDDVLLQSITKCPVAYHTVSSHTRWASVGAISEANCHPIDNERIDGCQNKCGVIQVCLNGDIDNYLKLKAEHEDLGVQFHQDITTDTKIIPLQIEKHIQAGHLVEEAFRLAVNDFEGSHAISMHTDMAPGKLFLAQRGSGQAIFIGLAKDHYMPTSEVYGFVEETSDYIKMDGEAVHTGKDGPTQGQIVILDQECAGGTEGISALRYDGTPMDLGADEIKHTEITSRDIDRQNFPHYLLKEISESPGSVEKTLQNRWKQKGDGSEQAEVALDEAIIPQKLRSALIDPTNPDYIRRVFFVGQGTAGVAAQACSDILNYYLNEPRTHITALKASELSGFKLGENDDSRSMADALVIAISQSGTTTDTNRTIDMVKERGAHTLAIVNRRDSDITFKVDGVMYTSSGRDVEMSVASTKAFYSQIVAGALLGLYIANLKNRRDDLFVNAEISRLMELPTHMRSVLDMSQKINTSAQSHATRKTYWAAVGSGPNKASADEIRIKLSELCYKTISSDFVEDKKHIDLSSEPLIIVCAAGTRNTVIGDLIKDTAIFKAHKATPIVITDESEHRFDPYAADVFYVPKVEEHLAPILNTLVGHLWGYYAALSINEGSRFLYEFQDIVQQTIDGYALKGLNIYEVILEKSFKEKIAFFNGEFRNRKAKNRLPTIMGLEAASDLTLLLKYLSGKIPVSDFELDFGIKGTPMNMLNTLFKCLGESVNCMARPIDAIKHQAKTVTVGTSRISDRVEGLLFEALTDHTIQTSQLTNKNILVLKNLQEVISAIKGSILYRIGNLNFLSEPTDDSTIEVLVKKGSCQNIPSRVEKDATLKGTKKIIVRQGNVYIGKGRKDDRSILVLPIISASPDTSNLIEFLLLFNIEFRPNVPLPVKIKALGGKFEHIKNIVQENSVSWQDKYIDLVDMEELFGRSAEKVGEYIVSQLN